MSPSRSSPPSSAQEGSRQIQISKSLSWLLRHGAAKERINISASGYAKLSDVLGWRKLKTLNVTLDEVVEVVRENEKQRFGLRWDGAGGVNGAAGAVEGSVKDEGESESKSQTETPHQAALARIEESASPDARDFSIRAVQGHSLSTIETISLLTPITIENAPATCVHGTFFAAWPAILRSGGLKPMSRNHVHFASGPAMSDVLPKADNESTEDFKLKQVMERSAVVSGMRGDAQVLIYVDVKRAIQEGGMEWWLSENGVILTEGIVAVDSAPTKLEETAMMLAETGADVQGKKPGDGERPKPANRRHSQQLRAALSKPQKVVPPAYWDVVVGIGVGVLWQRGKGVVAEVPPDMTKGRGKSKIAANGSGNGSGNGKAHARTRSKPKIRVERDDMDMDGFD